MAILDIYPPCAYHQAITATKAMNVSLTPELESLVRGLVDSGRYNSSSEVVREALRLVEEREQLRQIKLEALRSEIQKGLDDLAAGQSGPLDMEEIKREARALYEKRKAEA